MTTHNQEILAKLNRRVIKLDHGRVVSDRVGFKLEDDESDDDSTPNAQESAKAPAARKVGSL
jgi:ABC-type uncharacterized transport system ATPase subunit